MMIYTVHTYCGKHGATDIEHFEMTYNHGYGKVMTAQKQGPSLVPSKQG